MKKFLLSTITVLFLLSTGYSQAQDANDAKAQLKELVGKVQAQLKAGKTTEADLAPCLKEFDALLAKHPGEKTDDVAQILLMQAMLYVQVLEDMDKGLALINKLKTDFPETKQGKNADTTIAGLQKQQASAKLRSSLVVGTKFPDFAEKDLAGKPLSIANYKGKVVLLDFWATWCGPCVGELPNVLKTYQNHHAKGFEIIGISLDKEEKTLTDFLKAKGMAWPQFFDGKFWENKLAVKYGINSIPATYLLDGEGKIIAKNLRGEALEKAVEKALTK